VRVAENAVPGPAILRVELISPDKQGRTTELPVTLVR